MDARFFGGRSASPLRYGFRWAGLLPLGICFQLSIYSLADAGVAAAVRGPEDIDPLRTPWVYYESNDPNIGCRESEQAIIDAYITAKTGGPVCGVVYSGNDGWPTDPDAGSQWKDEHCDPPESTILNGYPLTVWSAKPVVKQTSIYHFIQTITHDYCPDNMFDIDVDQGFARVLFKYCPGGYDIRIEDVGGFIDWSRHFCTRGVDTPERDQEGSCLAVGEREGDDPIFLGTGNKYQHETDYSDARDARFTLERHYNSMSSIYRGVPTATGIFGVNWSSTFERRIRLPAKSSSKTALLYRDDGHLYYFNNDNGAWKSNSALDEQLIQTASGWEYHTRQDLVEVYDAGGSLTGLRYPDGVVHTLSYDATGRLQQVSTDTGESLSLTYVQGASTPLVESVQDQAGRVWKYAYDLNNNLVSVANPDGTPADDSDNPVKVYHYEDGYFPNALTGITDERGVRYATFAYDPNSHLKGRAITSFYGDAADAIARVDVDYHGHDTYNDGSTVRTVTDSKGGLTTYTTILQHGVALLQSLAGTGCSSCSGGRVDFSYDPVTNDLLLRTENGVATEFGNYDANGNPGYRIEASGTADERRTDYTYDPRYFGRIASVSGASVHAGAKRIATFGYDNYGNRISERIDGFTPAGMPVTRTTLHQYNGPLHQLSRIDGPRVDVNDVTDFRYYPDDPAEGSNRARLKEIENANGDIVRSNIRYSITGKVLSEDRSNGVSLLYTYYPGDDRLESLYENTASGTRSTRWTYLATGEVGGITVADGSMDATTLTFAYDAARRLVRITDGSGNYIRYRLDGDGNHVVEEIYDASGTPQDEMDDVLVYTLAQTFDAYDRLDLQTIGSGVAGPLQLRDPDYLQNGVLDRETDGNGVVTDYSYDALLRLLSGTRDLGGVNAVSAYGYDTRGNLATVTDPNNGTTTYVYDDLGNLLSTTSPDTGATVYTHDEAGNILSRTTASGTPGAVTLTYSYDALNRLTRVTTPIPAEDVYYRYDACANGRGRLCEVGNGYAKVFYQYDGFGNISSHQGIRMTHDTAGRLKRLEYPSGAGVGYAYDAAGRVSLVDMTVDGSTTVLAGNLDYMPFGEVTSMQYGNGHALVQGYDTAYRLVSQMIPSVMQLDYVDYDANGNLRQRDETGEAAGVSYVYRYDTLNRLDTAGGAFGSGWDYDYDSNGNRIMGDEGVPVTLSYDTGSNRLDQFGNSDVILDIAGNTLTKGSWHYSYTVHQRLHTTSDAGGLVVDYAYNGLGQRIVKNIAAGGVRRFLYGPDGRLLAETDPVGTVLVEYIWLNKQVLAVYHPDTDRDGVTNLQELEQGGAPGSTDNDGDGLLNIDELLVYGTSPANMDFDGDGVTDGEEVAQGTDPRDPASIPFMGIPGDINADGLVDLADYLLLTRFVLGYQAPAAMELQSADMNRDGVLDAGDLVLLSGTVLSISWNTLLDIFMSRSSAAILGGLISTAEAAVTAGKLYYVHNDHLGTPRVMTDETGNVVWRAIYSPFGQATIDASSTVALNLRFPGQYYDQETGLHYNYYRYYDPATGRYMTSDPIGLRGGTNLFSYGRGNPATNFDRFGLLPGDTCGRCSPGSVDCLLYGGNLCFPGKDVNLQQFPVHGNWCGPGWTAGRIGSWDDLLPGQRRNASLPIDRLDAACKMHDICYADCRQNNPCNSGIRSMCFMECDVVLETDAYKIGGLLGRLIGRAMRRPGNRNPGPDGEQCGCEQE